MPYTSTNWVSGSTPASASNMNNLETQYTEAVNSFGQDLFKAGFVYSGLTQSVYQATLSVYSGVAYLLQSDGSFRRRSTPGITVSTTVASTTYYYDLNPDGSYSWGTSHSTQSNYLTICTVTTTAGGGIATVTDTRPTAMKLLPNALGGLQVPALASIGGQATAGTFGAPVVVAAVQDVAITTTASVNVLTFTTPSGANSLYRVSIRTYNPAAGNITVLVINNDPNLGGTSYTRPGFIAAGAAAVVTLNGQSSNSTSWYGLPLVVECAASTSLTVNYQNSTATPNDKVSVIFERLA